MNTIKMIDVSKHQGTINWHSVAASGVTHVIIRAGYGRKETQEDVNFYTNYTAATELGLKVGAYWYSYMNSPDDALLECAVFLNILKKYNCILDLGVWYDVEYEPDIIAMSTQTRSIAVAGALKMLQESKYKVGLYGSADFLTNMYNWQIMPRVNIWLAAYLSDEKANEYISEFKLLCDYAVNYWQCNSTSTIQGISTNVDANVILEDIIKEDQPDILPSSVCLNIDALLNLFNTSKIKIGDINIYGITATISDDEIMVAFKKLDEREFT